MKTKEEQMKESCISYLLQRGYSNEEAKDITAQNFNNYSCDEAYVVIHQDY